MAVEWLDLRKKWGVEHVSDLGTANRPLKEILKSSSVCSKPLMRQRLLRREPLRWIKVRQTTDEILKVRVNILP